jgi:hypothetical protein
MNKKQKKRRVKASKHKNYKDVLMSIDTTAINFIEAAEGEDKLPTFTMNAYNGGVMSVGYYGNIVLNLSGLSIPKRSIPILQHHERDRIVGHGTARVEGNSLEVDGVVSGSSAAATEVTNSGKNGFPWQASLGATPVRITELSEGDSATVNGQKVVGPLSIINKSVLNEVSFVPLGADQSTSANVAANLYEGEITMEFAQWLEEMGLKADDLSEDQVKKLQAKYDAEIAAAKDDDEEKPAEKPEEKPAEDTSAQALADLQAEVEALKTSKKIDALYGDSHPELRAKANKEGWSVEKAQAELIKAFQSEGAQVDIELGEEDRTKRIDAMSAHLMVRSGGNQVFDMSEQEQKVGQSVEFMRLEDVVKAALKLEGKPVPADRGKMIRAAFSTTIIPNVINNVATKAAMKGFTAIPTTGKQLCNITAPTDYKVNERVRLDDNLTLDAVEYGNEVPHGDFKDTKESYKVVRYAEKVTLEEMDIVNDNLNLLSRIPMKYGGRASAKQDEIIYGIMTTNAAMSDGIALYHASHSNLQTSSALTIATLGAAITAMLKQTNRAGNYIAMAPKYLVVPITLWDTAKRILGSDRTVAALTTPVGEKNPVYASVEPVLSRDLEADSSSTWYLSADPIVNDTIELGYLNGVQTPTIETERSDLNTFGFTTRIRFDFGAKALDWRGVNKNTA